MSYTNLILLGNIRNLKNGPGRLLKLFPFKNYCPKIEGLRTLYTPSYLGLDGFLKLNMKVKEEYGDTSSFLNNLERFELENKTIFVEDLKILIACCGFDKSLLGDTIKMSKRYFDQVEDLHIRPYVFGSVLMRLLYVHDSVDEALQLILDKEHGKHFYQKVSYQLIMDKLFKKGRYEDVKILMNKLISEMPFEIPVTAVTLAVAANYKIGTEDALEDSLKLIRLSSIKRLQTRIIAFAAGLALKLDKPVVAREILEHSDARTHFLLSNIKVLTEAKLGRIDAALTILKSTAMGDLPKTSEGSRKLFTFDVMKEVEEIVNESLEIEKISQFKNLKDVFEATGLLSVDTLEEALCKPVRPHAPSDVDTKNRVTRRRYDK